MSKKQKTAGHPGVGKSKIMKKLAKKQKRKYVDASEWLRWAVPNGEINPVVMEWLARSPPENPYIFKPTQHGIGKSATTIMDEWDRNGLTFEQHSLLVEDLDINATCWDDQMSEMCRDFHTLRDRLVYAEDNDRLKLVDELLHRVIEVRCQLDTMKKEQGA